MLAHSSLVVSNVPAQGQLVYSLPKPLSKTTFCLLIDKLGIIDHYITLSLFWDKGEAGSGVRDIVPACITHSVCRFSMAIV